MKNKTRHELKDNDLADTLVAAADYIAPRSKALLRWGGVVVLVAVVVAAAVAVRQRSAGRGDALLADALVALNARVVPAASGATDGNLPAAASLGAVGTFATESAKLTAALPKLQAAADAYPDSTAGITARYHLGGALASLGRFPEAQAAFEDVIRRAGGDTLYGRMAGLGLADVQTRAGQTDAAIATLTGLADRNDPELPAEAVLMQLARAYVAKGSAEDARKTFTRIVDEHPDSPYSVDARAELATLTGS